MADFLGTSEMNLQHVHPGGYFQRVARGQRETVILQAALSVGQLVVIARSDATAREIAERLSLSGMPTIVGQADDRGEAVRSFATDGVSTLVASHDYLADHGPVNAPMVIHSRMATSTRQYGRRLVTAKAPVHLTFVVPEDERSATSLVVQLSDDAVLDLNGELDLTDALMGVDTEEPANVNGSRRRFPLVF
jgi:hypothetical protein